MIDQHQPAANTAPNGHRWRRPRRYPKETRWQHQSEYFQRMQLMSEPYRRGFLRSCATPRHNNRQQIENSSPALALRHKRTGRTPELSKQRFAFWSPKIFPILSKWFSIARKLAFFKAFQPIFPKSLNVAARLALLCVFSIVMAVLVVRGSIMTASQAQSSSFWWVLADLCRSKTHLSSRMCVGFVVLAVLQASAAA